MTVVVVVLVAVLVFVVVDAVEVVTVVAVVEDAVELIPHVSHKTGHKKATRGKLQYAVLVTSVEHSIGSIRPSQVGVDVVVVPVVVDEQTPHMIGQSVRIDGPRSKLLHNDAENFEHVSASYLP